MKNVAFKIWFHGTWHKSFSNMPDRCERDKIREMNLFQNKLWEVEISRIPSYSHRIAASGILTLWGWIRYKTHLELDMVSGFLMNFSISIETYWREGWELVSYSGFITISQPIVQAAAALTLQSAYTYWLMQGDSILRMKEHFQSCLLIICSGSLDWQTFVLMVIPVPTDIALIHSHFMYCRWYQ